MFPDLIKMGWAGMTRGEIYGVRVNRNPIAWVPFWLLLVVGSIVSLLVIIAWVAFMPIVVVMLYFSFRAFERKAGVFSDDGVYFPKAYGKAMIPWSEIREVFRVTEPKAIYYSIVCGSPENQREFVMCSTQDDPQFERTLEEKSIPFTVQDRFERAEWLAARRERRHRDGDGQGT